MVERDTFPGDVSVTLLRERSSMMGYFYFQIFLFLFFKKHLSSLDTRDNRAFPHGKRRGSAQTPARVCPPGSPRVSSPLSPEQPPGGLGVYKCGKDRGAPGSYKACLHTSLI